MNFYMTETSYYYSIFANGTMSSVCQNMTVNLQIVLTDKIICVCIELVCICRRLLVVCSHSSRLLLVSTTIVFLNINYNFKANNGEHICVWCVIKQVLCMLWHCKTVLDTSVFLNERTAEGIVTAFLCHSGSVCCAFNFCPVSSVCHIYYEYSVSLPSCIE